MGKNIIREGGFVDGGGGIKTQILTRNCCRKIVPCLQCLSLTQFYFFKCKQQKKYGISVFLSGSLTCHSKDLAFIPVHGLPGCLQHLNLGPDFIFFFKYVSNIEKYDINVLQVDL